MPADNRDAFLEAVGELGNVRRRGGAYAWTILEDGDDRGRFVETWREASWSQHLRHHERVSKADAEIQKRVQRLAGGEASPRVRHLMSVHRTSN